MELLKIEKYLDTPTTSCDTTSNVNDCYFLVPEKMRPYFNGVEVGLFDIQTNKQYIFPIVDNREFRLTQFNRYIDDKKITMGDQIIIYILRNNDYGRSFYIDVQYKDFFLQVNKNDNIYKLYVSDEFQNLFLETNKIELPLENEKVITIEKSGNEFIIDGTDKNKFILEKDTDVYKIINLERAKVTEIDASLIEDVVQDLEYGSKNIIRKEELKSKEETKIFIIDEIKYSFPHKNLLLKGVPGTGKSHTLETIIENDLKLKNNPKNICHINIHSASSNADLMQGIGINSNGGQIEYKEKQGLIYNHIKKALFTPNQPFVLILEEIQENSLNELIGDLIYLIEEKKRVTVDSAKFEDGKEYEYQEFIEKVLEDENNKHSIQIPYLVDTSTAYRKMVLPSNLYIFCTSNYRDDKKVIEDNLLRRFDVIEVYPKYEGIFESTDIPQFLKILNQEFLKQFDQEMHPDRYLVGHANWLYITNEDSEKNKKRFYTALLKVIIELKEIREIDFKNYTKKILEKVLQDSSLSYRIKEYIEACNFEYKSYKEMVEKLQSKIYPFL